MTPTVSARTTTVFVLALWVVVATAAVGAHPAPTDAAQQEAPPPDIQVRPVTLQFPAETDGSATRTLTVRNVGDGPLTVRSLVLQGPDRASFDPEFDGPVTVDPGERRTVTISFEATDVRARFATMHVLSDDPDEPQVNVWLTNTDTVADVSPSRVLETKTLVNATVRDAEANTTQSLNLSWPLTRDDVVAVDALSFTPERSGDFALSVATNESRFGDVPAFADPNGTDPAAFVHVDHTIANEHVRNVTFTVRVRTDRLAGNETGPEDVALYRYESGAWRELPTRIVAEGDTHYFFEARAPGLSDFATGVKQAQFRITDAVVTVTRITTAQGTEVLVRVRNVGGADGTYRVRLLLRESVVDQRMLSVAPNGTRQATFQRSFDAPGTYEVFVNDRFVGNVTVDPAPTATPDGADATGSPTGEADTEGSTTDPTGAADSPTGDASAADGAASGGGTSTALPGFDARTAVLALLVAALFLTVRRRR